MSKKALISIILTMLVVFNTISSSSFAATNSKEQSACGNALVKLGLISDFKGISSALKPVIKLYEFVTIVVKSLDYDSDTDLNKVKLPYKDIDKSHPAYNFIQAAYKYGIISGEDGCSLFPNDNLTGKTAMVILLNALGYTKDDYGASVMEFSDKLGLNKDINLTDSEILTKGLSYVLLCNYLITDFKV